MLKRLLLLWIFSGSLDSFSQVADTIWDFRNNYDGTWTYGPPKKTEPAPKPDTLRAICLVTLFPNGIAHARMGFVVIAEGKEVEYLDCRKKALKLPQVGWGYRLIDPNYKQK